MASSLLVSLPPPPTTTQLPPESSSCNLTLPTYKWRMVIAYDGTHFSVKTESIGPFNLDWLNTDVFTTEIFGSIGRASDDWCWQYQQSSPSVQRLIEKALTKATKLNREDFSLVGASRTDTGVHAWGQVAHFTTFNYDSLDSIHAALNGILPSTVRVREISPALPTFHARFSAKSKIYHYKIYNDCIMDPFQFRYAYHSPYRLNASAMRDAAKHFVGRHDFTSFVNASHNAQPRDPVKTIMRFDVIEQGTLIQLEVEGSGFLYRQVRNMVSLLLQIGKEAIPPDIVPLILDSRDRKELAKYTVATPPHGLCLMSIKYDENLLEAPSDRPTASSGRHYTIRRCKLPFQ